MALWVLYAAILNACTKRAAPRDKTLHYQERDLPDPKIGDKLQCSKIAADMVAAFSRDPKMITLDADMGLISGLQPGMLKHAGNRGHQCRHC